MRKTSINILIVYISIFFVTAMFLVSCSRNIRVENMMPSEFNVINQHPYTVSLAVKGQMGLSSPRGRRDDVDHERLNHVIQRSLTESGLFKSLAPEQEADFLLEVIVFSSNVIGPTTATVTTVVPMNWVLMSRDPRKSIYQKRTSHEVSIRARDNLGGANRFSAASEGSIKKSIQEAIFDMSQLDLSR